ncbi:hypothetical protein LguiA_023019 [Lonicera macranthoides]
MGHWSNLPRDLLDEIENHLVLYVDKVRVRAVCMSWNSHLPKMPNHQTRRVPWLLQSFENNTEASHGLFDLFEKKFYKIDLPEAQGKLFKGCSYGWLATIGDDLPIGCNSPDMYLINPLTNAQIQLPPRYTCHDVADYVADRIDEEYTICHPNGTLCYLDAEYINSVWTSKVVLSSNPSHEDCLVVAIYGDRGYLAWCKCNDKKWKRLPCSLPGAIEDVIFYNGKLHALHARGILIVFENICPNPTVKEIARLPSSIRNYSDVIYLVECSDGGLLMVMRLVASHGEEDYLPLRTKMFKVYKLDSINSTWVEVRDIGNDILFLGLNTSFSVSSHDFPGHKGNSIYYTDNSQTFFATRKEKHACSDMGVFNLGDQSFESLPGFKGDRKLFWPPPIWVTAASYY